MTTDDRFGPNLSTWLHEEAEHRVPDHLAEVLVHTAASRQRPWWSSPERLVPMKTPTLGVRVAVPRPIVVFAALVALVAATLGLALLVGSQRSEPKPFGLAANGRIFVFDGTDLRSFDDDGSDPRLERRLPLVRDARLSIAPDGTRIATLSTDGDSSWIQALELVDGTFGDIWAEPEHVSSGLAWSPDGQLLAYAVTDPSSGRDALRIADSRRWGPPRTLVGSTPEWSGSILDPSFAPDGEWIVFASGQQFGETRLFVVRPDGSALISIGTTGVESGDGNAPAWSPDPAVRRIAYTTMRDGQLVLRILDMDAGIDREIGPGFWPAWSPDGQRLAYWHDGIAVIAAEAALRGDTADAIRVGRTFTGTCQDHPELAGMAFCSPVTWSPDGTKLVGADIVGTSMVVLNADGTGEPLAIPLSISSSLDIRPVWQPVRP